MKQPAKERPVMAATEDTEASTAFTVSCTGAGLGGTEGAEGDSLGTVVGATDGVEVEGRKDGWAGR